MDKKILFYDIETTPLKAYVWRLGDQTVRHGQLTHDGMMTDIICIAYCWNDGKPAKVLHWGYHKQDSSKVIEKFDKLIQKADIVIGKNSTKFDNKHINTHRMLNGMPGMPDWTKYTDDLETQMRRTFALPSYSLDYFSRLLGIGGKVKMEFSDWIDIVEKRNKASFDKMLKYNKKDTEDTRYLWEYCEKHFMPKLNHNAGSSDMVCANCGSLNVVKHGTRRSGKNLYQRYFCNDHGGYAGRKIIPSGMKAKNKLSN